MKKLNDNEISELTRLAQNPLLLGTLKKLFLEIELTIDLDSNNERLGQDIRAIETAKDIAKRIFKEIEKLTKKDEPRKVKLNPAV